MPPRRVAPAARRCQMAVPASSATPLLVLAVLLVLQLLVLLLAVRAGLSRTGAAAATGALPTAAAPRVYIDLQVPTALEFPAPELGQAHVLHGEQPRRGDQQGGSDRRTDEHLPERAARSSRTAIVPAPTCTDRGGGAAAAAAN
eukprot:SAG31_NODE_15118_length_770_cov_0.734724_1_plen_144_part_00